MEKGDPKTPLRHPSLPGRASSKDIKRMPNRNDLHKDANEGSKQKVCLMAMRLVKHDEIPNFG